MLVVFVHGWGVLQADYGALPAWLQQQNDTDAAGLDTMHVWLSDYITYSDHVTMEDLIQAFERARQSHFPGEKFACITHSTGGPVLRSWLDRFYGSNVDAARGNCPLTHLIMLAPPSHGSALAQLGKSRISRMKFWLQDAEPGEKILDCLELGSPENWRLNLNWLKFDWTGIGVFAFVLVGDGIDHALYDHLNSYTGEHGSDGVVRCASANLNFAYLRFAQDGNMLSAEPPESSAPMAFGILNGLSHSGANKGILTSVTATNAATHPTAHWVKRCLRVVDDKDYDTVADELSKLAIVSQGPCSMVIFRVTDSSGEAVNDYDLLLTSGDNYDPDHLPKGFFIDRQRNSRTPNVLTYFFDHDSMSQTQNLGFKLIPRPDSGSVRYQAAEFKGSLAIVESVLKPHQTMLVDITLQRWIDDEVFRVRTN